jgi:expansin (peptidoglycan-binding protein)
VRPAARRALVAGAIAAALGVACGAPGSGGGTTKDTSPQTTSLGEAHAGDYSLGPVAFSGSFWNSCAPYTPDLERQAGAMLAGLALKWNGSGALCDACVLVKTARGKSVVAQVVTTGETQGPNDLDLSQAAFDAIHAGEYPRKMTWELVKCPHGGKVQYQFQTEANPYWTSLWVRNARVPIAMVEVTKASGATATLVRGGDGTLTDATGFGDGPFTLRVTAVDGQVISDAIPKIVPGSVVPSSGQFE